MKETLLPGIKHTFRFRVPESKTVPALYPESAEFQLMPVVLATGYMVGLIEWACIQAINPHLEWPAEQTVGTHINVNHIAPTPPGLTVQVKVQLTKVEGRKLTFSIIANDGVDEISKGVHERFIINAESFNKNVEKKRTAAMGNDM